MRQRRSINPHPNGRPEPGASHRLAVAATLVLSAVGCAPPHRAAAPARPSTGSHQPKPSTITYAHPNKAVLRRTLETGQYLSIRYTDRLAEAGIEASVGNIGDSYDNALAETINGLYKTEVIRPNGPWRGIEAIEFATLEWVDWFNNRRLLAPIGNIPPAEFEAMYVQSQASPTTGVGLN